MTTSATEEQWETAQTSFINRMAARQLIDETSNSPKPDQQNLPLSVQAIRAMTGTGATSQPFGENATPIPIGAIRLYRAFLAREGLAFSRHARAASSDVVTTRAIGAYQLELVLEEDALFIIITLDGNTPPGSMILLHENGQNHKINLPDPIEDNIQEGLSRHAPENKALIDLLLDPVTSITLI